MLAANPDTDLFDVEIAFRDGGAHSYLITGETLSIVFGMQAMLAAVTAAGMTVKQNRAALAASFSPRLNRSAARQARAQHRAERNASGTAT